MQKGFSIILIALAAIVVIGAAGYFLFVYPFCEKVADYLVVCVNGYVSKMLQKEQSSLSPTESSKMPSPTDYIKDWKTYRSEEYGFEFKYPPEWGELITDLAGGCFNYDTQSYHDQINGRPCVIVNVIIPGTGIFFAAQSKLQKETGAPREPYFGDFAVGNKEALACLENASFPNCAKNVNEVAYAKTRRLTYEIESENYANYWWIARPDSEFAGIVITDERFPLADIASGAVERKLNLLIGTLKFIK